MSWWKTAKNATRQPVKGLYLEYEKLSHFFCFAMLKSTITSLEYLSANISKSFSTSYGFEEIVFLSCILDSRESELTRHKNFIFKLFSSLLSHKVSGYFSSFPVEIASQLAIVHDDGQISPYNCQLFRNLLLYSAAKRKTWFITPENFKSLILY